MTGSSPRMRGAHFHHGFYRVGVGIIPAYAGSTEPSWPRASAWRDHPRVCGEHASSVAHDSVSFGSSPRMRGAPDIHDAPTGSSPRMRGAPTGTFEAVVQGRIIPAYAGSTESSFRIGLARAGSSPRMRGAHHG